MFRTGSGPQLSLELPLELPNDVALEVIDLLRRQRAAIGLEDDSERDRLPSVRDSLARIDVERRAPDHQRVAVDNALYAGSRHIVVHDDGKVSVRLRVPARAHVCLAQVSDYGEQRVETDFETSPQGSRPGRSSRAAECAARLLRRAQLRRT